MENQIKHVAETKEAGLPKAALKSPENRNCMFMFFVSTCSLRVNDIDLPESMNRIHLFFFSYFPNTLNYQRIKTC